MHRIIIAAVLAIAGTLTVAGSVAADDYTPEFRACVAKNYRWWNDDWAAWLAKYPNNPKAEQMYRARYPATYEQALTHPRIGEVCPLGGNQ